MYLTSAKKAFIVLPLILYTWKALKLSMSLIRYHIITKRCSSYSSRKESLHAADTVAVVGSQMRSNTFYNVSTQLTIKSCLLSFLLSFIFSFHLGHPQYHLYQYNFSSYMSSLGNVSNNDATDSLSPQHIQIASRPTLLHVLLPDSC